MIDDYAWVIERNEPFDPWANKEIGVNGIEGGKYWRNGHGGSKHYRPSQGWWDISQAKLYQKQNDAIRQCVKLGSKNCTVRRVTFCVTECIYPPSRKNLEAVL